MEDPELQRRGSPVIQTLRKGGGGGVGSPKNIFRPFGPPFGRKISGGGGASPKSATEGSLILKLALYRPAACDDIKQ